MTGPIVRREPSAVAPASSQSLTTIAPNTAAALEAAATQAVQGFSAASTGSILAQLEVAANIEQLRILFDDPQIKARIVALQDAPIGFRTDKDPKIKNYKTNQYNTPYPYDVVKDAVIEASLRGLQLVGNQFNIIAGRFYCTKEGFEGLIRKLDYVADFRPIIGVPQAKNGGVIIDCSASWTQNGNKRDIQASIPIKENSTGTADQYIGKATRKLLKRCYEMMTGNSINDGDTEDAQSLPLNVVSPAIAAAASPVATLTPDQVAAIMTAAERQMTPLGVAAFLAELLTAFEVSKIEEIPADKQQAIINSLANLANKARWNQNKNKSGNSILSDEEIAELQKEANSETISTAAKEKESNDDEVSQTELV